jgi:diguanylate cyclase (GGDEF)-like protein
MSLVTSSQLLNAALFAVEAVVYFGVLAVLFRARARIGIGAFFCALGVMHFLETYLAAILYVELPFGIIASPGSVVLFTGKLMLMLMVYIRDDAVVVRQPIYGLLLGNMLLLTLALVIRHHVALPLSPGREADFGFVDQMGWLMVWGTAVLFVDCILMILAYEQVRRLFGGHLLPRLLLCGAAIMTFDQMMFFGGLRLLTGAPYSVLVGGWIAKMAAVALYAPLVSFYLRHLEPRKNVKPMRRLADVFDLLTYRERYEDLLARSGRDALTGALDRGRLESQGRAVVDAAALAGRPASVLLVDIDHFKSFNDRYGHAAGDAVLKRIAANVMAQVRASDLVFRFGGEEFVVICDGMAGTAAAALGERIRREVAGATVGEAPRVTVSIGVASCAEDASDYNGLFAVADERLYAAKAAGRNAVIGERLPETEDAPHLALVR